MAYDVLENTVLSTQSSEIDQKQLQYQAEIKNWLLSYLQCTHAILSPVMFSFSTESEFMSVQFR